MTRVGSGKELVFIRGYYFWNGYRILSFAALTEKMAVPATAFDLEAHLEKDYWLPLEIDARTRYKNVPFDRFVFPGDCKLANPACCYEGILALVSTRPEPLFENKSVPGKAIPERLTNDEWFDALKKYNQQAEVRNERQLLVGAWEALSEGTRHLFMSTMFGPMWRAEIKVEPSTKQESLQPMFSNAQWAKLLDSTFSELSRLAKTKGEEYSGTVDRLANFRRGALALGLTKEQVLMVYAGKHWDAIQTYVKEQADPSGTSRVLSEPISGRVDDLLVYLLLFKAMLEESRERSVIAPKSS